MTTKNSLRVAKHRHLIGNETQKEKYRKLRDKFGIESTQANTMKFWSVERILDYLQTNKIYPLKTLKEVDRL